MSLLYSHSIIPFLNKRKKIQVLPYFGCTVLLVPRGYSLDTEGLTLILKIGFILEFIDAIDLGFGCLYRTEFLPSRADIIILDDDGLSDCPASLPRDRPTFGDNYINSDKITGGVEGEQRYSCSEFRSSLGIRCFIVFLFLVFFKRFFRIMYEVSSAQLVHYSSQIQENMQKQTSNHIEILLLENH